MRHRQLTAVVLLLGGGVCTAQEPIPLPHQAVGLPASLLPGPAPVLRPPPIPAAPAGSGFAEAIDACVASDMARYGTPGASVAVMLDGSLVYERGYGVRHWISGTPADPDTVFRIGSITKMMTTAAVLQLVEQGLVDLEAPVTEYVPELTLSGRWSADTIRVRQLLNHTSAFPDVIIYDHAQGELALSSWATHQESLALYAPPGSYWNYSNPNFMLAGLVAERASGVPYRELIEDRVWAPTGMTHTTFDPWEVVRGGNYTFGHIWSSNTESWVTISPATVENWAAGPAGWAMSTAGDLVRWADLLMAGGAPVLAARSAELMQAPSVWTDTRPDLYCGLGTMVETYKGIDGHYHGGNISGWGSLLYWVPERRLAVAVLANAPEALVAASYCIVDAVLGLPAEVEPPDFTTDPSTWQELEGSYDLYQALDGESFHAEVFLEDDRLWATVTGDTIPLPEGVTVEMVQIYPTTFLVDEDFDGVFDVDFSFVISPGAPGRADYLRNRHVVGTRGLPVREPAGREQPGP